MLSVEPDKQINPRKSHRDYSGAAKRHFVYVKPLPMQIYLFQKKRVSDCYRKLNRNCEKQKHYLNNKFRQAEINDKRNAEICRD